MNETARARKPEEQDAETRRRWELSYGHRREDWPDPLREPYEPTQDELDLLQTQQTGHRWNAWRRLTGDEDYYAACSCGWRSTETGYVSPMLHQVQDHHDAVRAIRGWGPAPSTAPAPHRDEQERDVGQHEMRADERARELYASIEGQQQHLAQTAEHFSDLLAASEVQDKVVQRVFAAGVTLCGAIGLMTQPGIRRRVEAAADELDEVIRVIRDAVFDRPDPAASHEPRRPVGSPGISAVACPARRA
jgi:hypothetical protein